MNFEEFKQQLMEDLKEALSRRVGTEVAVEENEVHKLQQESYDGIVARKENESIGVNVDAEIIGVVISGSRCRGLEGKNSDLDVVVQLSGNEREDDLFNLLHEDKFRIGGVLVDINPITEYKTGTLEEYLPGVEKYLEEKAMQMGKKLSVTADLQSKKMQVAGKKKKETKRDCKKSETII